MEEVKSIKVASDILVKRTKRDDYPWMYLDGQFFNLSNPSDLVLFLKKMREMGLR